MRLDGFWRVTRAACAGCMAAITVLTFVDVVGRYLLARTLPGGYDLALRLQAFAIFWGIALACQERSHICVDLVLEVVRGRAVVWVQRFADGCTLLFFALAALAALLQLPKMFHSGERLAGIDLPAWPFYLGACLGLALAALAAVTARRAGDGLSTEVL